MKTKKVSELEVVIEDGKEVLMVSNKFEGQKELCIRRNEDGDLIIITSHGQWRYEDNGDLAFEG